MVTAAIRTLTALIVASAMAVGADAPPSGDHLERRETKTESNKVVYFVAPSGKLEGIKTIYDDMGRIREVESWHDGKQEGIFLGYDEHGTLRAQGQYHEGVPTGDFLTFDDSGNCIDRQHRSDMPSDAGDAREQKK